MSTTLLRFGYYVPQMAEIDLPQLLDATEEDSL
jgi:hypothetical protein